MNTLLLPVEKNKNKKTVIRGLWKDNNVIYYDYLKAVDLPYLDNKVLSGYCITFNQLALFYKQDKKAVIFTCKTEQVEVLHEVKKVSHTGFKGLKKACSLR